MENIEITKEEALKQMGDKFVTEVVTAAKLLKEYIKTKKNKKASEIRKNILTFVHNSTIAMTYVSGGDYQEVEASLKLKAKEITEKILKEK